MSEMPDVIWVDNIYNEIDAHGDLATVGYDDDDLKSVTKYLRADLVAEKDALLKQARGRLNASNYMGMHDEVIAAIDKHLGEME